MQANPYSGNRRLQGLWRAALLMLAPGWVLGQTPDLLPGNGALLPANPHLYADVVLEGDAVSGAYTFHPLVQDIGKNAAIHVVALVSGDTGEQWFRLESGRWLTWDRNVATLRSRDTPQI